jgi:hypothetical protein
MANAEDIVAVLEDLKAKDGRIAACMVAKRGLEGVIVFPTNFKDDVAGVWEPLSRQVDDMLVIVSKYSPLGLSRGYSHMLGYGALFTALGQSDTALIVFLKGDDRCGGLQEIAALADEAKDRIMGVL